MTSESALPKNKSIQPQEFIWLLIGGILYFSMAKLGMSFFSLKPNNITLLWLPSGIGLVMYLWSGWRALPFVLAASFAANYTGMAQTSVSLHLLHTLIAASADTFSALLAGAMLKRYLPHGLNSLANLFSFMILVCVIPTTIVALILSSNLVLGGYIPSDSALSFIGMLVLADSLGILLVYPLFDDLKKKIKISMEELRLWLLITLLSIVVVYLAFYSFTALIYLVIPALVYLVFHSRAFAVHLTLMIVVTLVVIFAGSNLGPFNMGNELQSRFMLQSFLFTTAILIVGMVLQQRDLIKAIQSGDDWKFLADHDQLTGLKNRQSFLPLMHQEIKRSERNQHKLTVALVDIDHFKTINDTYGHFTGDKVLVEVSAKLKEILRNYDVIARIGGEEFALLFPETSLDKARELMERLRKEIENFKITADEHSVSVTVSAGLAEWQQEQPEDVHQILTRADQLLYDAKHSGRNIVKG